MNKNFAAVFVALVVLISCNSRSSQKENITPDVYSNYLQKGNDISNLAQGVLLANVGKAIQQGGAEHAVEFCNLKASAIIDSLNRVNHCDIFRVSEKNRNPGNTLQNETDRSLWAHYSTQAADRVNDTLIQSSEGFVFYKPIRIALPACLKCHGTVGEEIDQLTNKKLHNLYPSDLATGYKLNDFRGMWKIEFEAN
ncbi:DUF3365 domain-containing protein [Maribellus comscasis]|uniref:DUF3365 domain-containing protein n=1 Tax=Maribellus comscasis TaxID=2681766 RepID=A0A6I6JLG1_9BACT|nr:DUF3365 domain-containing protein [Maribellus comscasis]QGY43695.1 DUF3365 domain-containing protein [Maribellus comscasis]